MEQADPAEEMHFLEATLAQGMEIMTTICKTNVENKSHKYGWLLLPLTRKSTLGRT